MKKGFSILILMLAISLLFISCAGVNNLSALPEPTEKKEFLTLPTDLVFPDWVPENEIKHAYYYALFSAGQYGRGCDYVEERIDVSSADAKFFLAEDGQGFCLYSIFSGMSQREFLLLGTENHGSTWSVCPETVCVTTYLNDPIPYGDYALIKTSNTLEISESILVVKKDGTDIEQISAESLVPDGTLPDVEPYYTFTSIAVDSDQTVSFELAAHDRETGDTVLEIIIQATLDKEMNPIQKTSVTILDNKVKNVLVP